jgi:hypothetical protein
MGIKMNKIKQWIFGLALLILSPFLLLIFALVSISIKVPIWVYFLYKESWEEIRKARNKNVK